MEIIQSAERGGGGFERRYGVMLNDGLHV